MTFNKNQRYAARLNAFKIGGKEYWPGKNIITSRDLIERASMVSGLNAADLNYPDHFEDDTPAELTAQMRDVGMSLNGLAMRYYTNPGFKLGAFTNPDKSVRKEAIDLTLHGIDVASEMGASLMTLWMGQDGFDYSFQLNYQRAWDDTIEALAIVCDHNPDIDISLEYKPNEPRSFSLMPDVGTNLLALNELNRKNTGMTLDFAHVLYADEVPAHSAAIISRYSRVLGVHLNDGYAKRDDGLMVGSVHPQQTVELLVELIKCGYDSAIYFDTFPDLSGLDPIAEAQTNVSSIRRLIAIAENLSDSSTLNASIDQQNAPASQAIVMRELFGAS